MLSAAEAPAPGLSFSPFIAFVLQKLLLLGVWLLNKWCPGWSRPVWLGSLVTLSSGRAWALRGGVAQAWQPAMQSGWCGSLELLTLHESAMGVLHTHLTCCRSTVLPEWGIGSCESELFVQGEENALFAHVSLFLDLSLLLTGGDRCFLLYCAGNPLVFLVSFRRFENLLTLKEES